jgi:hypothetical protein
MVQSPATAAGRRYGLYLCQPQTGETGGSGRPKSAKATLQKFANLQELPSSFVDDKQAAYHSVCSSIPYPNNNVNEVSFFVVSWSFLALTCNSGNRC